jgi:hypothetical protein
MSSSAGSPCCTENETGETWYNLRRTLGSLKVGIHGTRSGQVWQTSPSTADQTRAFQTLGVAPPPRYYSLPKPGRESS